MTKFPKGHNLKKYKQILFKSWTIHLLIISYNLTKFRVPSSNTFWVSCWQISFSKGHKTFKSLAQILFEYLADKFHFQRAITPYKSTEFVAKVSQFIYTSSSISWPNFKSLAQMADNFNMPKFSKDHNSEKVNRISPKVNQFIYS